MEEGCKESLKFLGLEYLDLFLIHFPVSFVPGVEEATSASQVEEIPLKDTWLAMEKLAEKGAFHQLLSLFVKILNYNP